MLRLCNQIAGDENRVALLADENSFGRTSQELNRAIECNQLLGRSHIPVAGTDDLVHARDALRPISQRSNRLRPTNAIELAHTEKRRRSQSRLSGARRHHTNPRHAHNLGRNHGHQQCGRQRIPSTGDIASYRFQRPHQLPHTNSGMNFAPPLLWFLPLAVAANIICGLGDGLPQLGSGSLPGLKQINLGHAHRFAAAQPVPPRRIMAQSTFSIASDIAHDAPNRWLDLSQIARPALLERTHEPVFLSSLKNAHHLVRPGAHHITTLFSGYSTMPCAFASLSFGIRFQAVCSSMMVLTATHSPSARGATVGFLRAGSSPRTPARSGLRTLSINPTRPCAAIAPDSITARFSILRRRAGSDHAALLAISCVFDSSTVSTIRRWLARNELPVSVTSTMASASKGGFTSVAPQENSTRTGTFSLAK